MTLPVLPLLIGLSVARAASPSLPLGLGPDLSSRRVALRCDKAGAGASLFGLLTTLPGMSETAGDPVFEVLRLIGEPEAARAAGIDLGAPLELLQDEVAGEQAVRLRLGLEDPSRVASWMPDPPPDGWQSRIEGRELSIDKPASSSLAGPALSKADPLLAELLDQPGCILRSGSGAGGLAFFVPAAAEAPMRVRLRLPFPVPSILARSQGRPVGGSSLVPPSMVFVLGVSPLELMDAVSAVLPMPAPLPPGLADLRETVRMDPGATLAFWPSAGSLEVAAVFPMRRANGRALPPRRTTRKLLRALKTREIPAERTSGASLRLHPKKAPPIDLLIKRDRVIAGSAGRVVFETAQDRGQPWVSPALARVAETTPLSVQVRMDEGLPAGLPPGDIVLGLRANEAYLEVLLSGGPPEVLLPRLALLPGVLQGLRRESGAEE